ncbi:Uncharacterised protein [Legionella steigerwaltii]|uniref:Coiled-coil protein n=1 Tax=Legionella steigerwaltii TaxID=460 RepID=A0A378L4X8_9GAMM|nr:hypothetical protein [Legionella steigerwaltii]KTD78127.1 hypothetical protein Lstg_1408 [Legionella steigerwaltii]STY22135.1 Uncharacterised protein [Legionella steigerwaltii]
MTLEKRLTKLENEIEELKLDKLDLDGIYARMQALTEQMEKQLNQYENVINSAQAVNLNNGELLNRYGIMKPPRQQESLELTFSGPHTP